jgi:hypothetical protein
MGMMDVVRRMVSRSDILVTVSEVPGNAAGVGLRCARCFLGQLRDTHLPRHPEQPASANANATTGYLAFLGGIAAEMRVDRAIAIARAARLPMKIAAKVDEADQVYFDGEIRHLPDQSGVAYVDKIATLSDRLARTVRPSDRSYGLRNAGSCLPEGSVPEVIDNGISEVIVGSMEEARDRQGDALVLNRAPAQTL